MNFAIFAIFLAVGLTTTIALAVTRRKDETINKDFWEKERQANLTRKKPLDDLTFINIPLDKLPVNTEPDNPKLSDYINTIKGLSEEKIVNFTGLSNTDLKLRYGAPNIEILSRYDMNFTTLVSTLQKWAEKLYELHYVEEAKCVLEYAVSIHTDSSITYKLLCRIYDEEGTPERKAELIPVAESLNSVMKQTILRMLNE